MSYATAVENGPSVSADEAEEEIAVEAYVRLFDLYLPHEGPGSGNESNCALPPRDLGVTMRLYTPASQALDGRWNAPPISRTT